MNEFLWSDNINLENDTAWFVSGYGNLLFKLHMHTGQCEYVTAIPNGGIETYRKNPYCIKIEDAIVCMPQNESSAYVYNPENGKFSRVLLSDHEEIGSCGYWNINKKYLYLLSYNLNKIFVINIDKNAVDKTYSFPAGVKGRIESGVLNKDSIYCVNSADSTICRFHIDTEQFELYSIPQIHTGLNCICFDGNNFLLSGYRKEVYIWNMEHNTVKTLDDFPKAFGLYNYLSMTDEILDCLSEQYSIPTFFQCVIAGKRAWFIPYQTNFIIYVDIDNYCVGYLMIEKEKEDLYSLNYNRILSHKYLLGYIRENRYIGIYSIKNKSIFEIDSQELSVCDRNFDLVNEDAVLKTLQDFCARENVCLNEKNALHRWFFQYAGKNNRRSNTEGKMGSGEKIYQFLSK